LKSSSALKWCAIDQTYNSLFMIISGVTNATGTDLFRCAPNGTTNIAHNIMVSSATTLVNEINTYIRFTGGGSTGPLFTNANNSWGFTINNYASTSAFKPFSIFGGYNNPGNYQGTWTGGQISTTTAISSLVFSNAGGNLSTGTVLLYGVK
jgi:hypothetical protein